MVKVTPATQLHDPVTEKSQNHHPHSTNGEKNDCENVMIDAFRWSRCKKPLPQKLMRTIGIPLPLEHIEVFLNHFSFIFNLHFECLLNFLPDSLLQCYSNYVQNAYLNFSIVSIIYNLHLLSRYWRKIWTGKMCNGRKLVFGLLERNIPWHGCISCQ